MSKLNTLKTIELHKAVAVLRITDERLFDPIAEALYRGGVRILEITLTVPNAIDLIRKASKSLPDDMLLGVGSILNAEQVRESVDAGARFVVSPITKKEVIDQAKSLDVAVMAGACAVGVGSALVSRLDVENRDFKAIEEKAGILVEALL